MEQSEALLMHKNGSSYARYTLAISVAESFATKAINDLGCIDNSKRVLINHPLEWRLTDPFSSRGESLSEKLLFQRESGYVNSLPYIAQMLVTWASSFFSDYLVNKGYSSTDILRKICNTLSCVGLSCSLIGVTYSGCDKTQNTIYLVAGMIFAGFGYPASQIVPLDMTLNFAGTLMGFVSTLASMAGFIIPLIVGSLTSTEQKNCSEWDKVTHHDPRRRRERGLDERFEEASQHEALKKQMSGYVLCCDRL
ncbi:hypothetical protein AVEN_24133-1 [Araneus ventricosus]|uniref:Inorganic phosphate cotransporter n=1 Tax=Araneus ventricosus TaxID=182803 RepID=A0A4Y2H389_ARAVE|nr:hypothetical protein AVEN_24133-1 [Araneus ventricosus]